MSVRKNEPLAFFAEEGWDENAPEPVKVNDFILPEYRKEFEKRIEFLWGQLMLLNERSVIAETIKAFPFDLLHLEFGAFWKHTCNVLVESCYLIAYKLIADQNTQELKFTALKNRFLCTYLDPARQDIRDSFITRWKSSRFKEAERILERNFKEIRHTYVAHYDSVKLIDDAEDTTVGFHLSLSNLLQIRDALNIVLQSFMLGTGEYAAAFDSAYDAKVRPGSGHYNSPQTDIEKLLLELALNSPMVNAWEQNPGLWAGFCLNHTDEEIELINSYRRKKNLADASRVNFRDERLRPV
jgi:hypothetical protein